MMASTQQRTANDQRAYGCCQRRKPRALPTPATTNRRTTKTVWLRHWTVHAIARRQPVCRVAAGSPGSFMDANQPKAQSDVVVILSRKVGDLIRGLCGLTFELSGRQRQDARPDGRKMSQPGRRAWWPAVGAPLERGVRRHREAAPLQA